MPVVDQSSPVTDVQEAVPVAQETMYLIRKNGMFYRPNAQGYTCDAAYAGRFTLAEAIRHSHPNGSDGPRDGIDYMPTNEPTVIPPPCKSGEDAGEGLGVGSVHITPEIDAALHRALLASTTPAPDATQMREAELQAEIERLRGLLISPGDPAWEDARAVVVAELRKNGMDTHADNIAASHAVPIPSWIALNLIGHSRAALNGRDAA